MDNQFPIVNRNSTHTPMTDEDRLDSSIIPLSARVGNLIRTLPDGVYYGTSLGADTFYVADAGVDDPTNGVTKAAPFKTLAYALAEISARSLGNVFTGKVNIALKAGETFILTNDFTNNGDLTLTFYDSLYGDFDSPAVGTGCQPAYMSDLNRPTITTTSFNGSMEGTWQSSGFRTTSKGILTFLGVSVNIAVSPGDTVADSAFGGYCDIATCESGELLVNLKGSIFDMKTAGTTSGVYGILGTWANAKSTVSQYASKITVDGIVLNSALVSPEQLDTRQYAFKMYSAPAGNNQNYIPLRPVSNNSTPGSGFMQVMWDDTPAQLVQGTTTNQSAFPILFDVTYGFRNYLTGVTRDASNRVLNILSSRLF